MKKTSRKRPRFPRVVTPVSTSSKKFVDGKTRSKSRRELNRKAAEEAAEEQDRGG